MVFWKIMENKLDRHPAMVLAYPAGMGGCGFRNLRQREWACAVVYKGGILISKNNPQKHIYPYPCLDILCSHIGYYTWGLGDGNGE
jgi:hypothetical protein